MIAVDLSKQQALDADLKALQKIHFNENLDQAGPMSFIPDEAKEIILEYSQKTVRVL